VVQEIPGVVSGLGSVSEEVVKYKVPAAGKYTIEVTAKDIYENTAKVTTAISLDLLKITIVPESTFMIVKQGTSTGISVVVEGPAKTGTVSLSRITVENGQVKSTVVKAKTFTGNNFADPTFIEASLDAGRYQINVEVKSAFGFVSRSSRRVVIDGQAPKIDDVTVISDTGAIAVEKQINGNDIDILVRTEQSTTGQLVLKASDDYTYFDVYLDGAHIGGWGDTGASGEGTFFVPVNLDIGSSQTYTVELVDEAGNNSEYTLVLQVKQPVVDKPPIVSDVKLDLGGYKQVLPINGGVYSATVPLPLQGTLTFSVVDDIEVTSVAVNGQGLALSADGKYSFTLDFDRPGSNVITITAKDSSDQTTTFKFTVNLHQFSGRFELTLEAGVNYFGIPFYVDKTLGEIMPGVDVYRRSGNSWVLANNEKPKPFAVYRASLQEAKVIVLENGVPYQSTSITFKQYSSVYISIPQTDPVSAEELFGNSLLSISMVSTDGKLVDVPDKVMKPGKAYIIILGKDVTIRLP